MPSTNRQSGLREYPQHLPSKKELYVFVLVCTQVKQNGVLLPVLFLFLIESDEEGLEF